MIDLPGGGSVQPDLTHQSGRYELHWFNVQKANALPGPAGEGGKEALLQPAGRGHGVSGLLGARGADEG